MTEQLGVSFCFFLWAAATDFSGYDGGKSELCCEVQILKPNNQKVGTVKCFFFVMINLWLECFVSQPTLII